MMLATSRGFSKVKQEKMNNTKLAEPGMYHRMSQQILVVARGEESVANVASNQ